VTKMQNNFAINSIRSGSDIMSVSEHNEHQSGASAITVAEPVMTVIALEDFCSAVRIAV